MTSAATRLVEIAEELFTFGCVSEQRGARAGDPATIRSPSHLRLAEEQPGREAATGRHPPGHRRGVPGDVGRCPAHRARRRDDGAGGQGPQGRAERGRRTTLAAFLGGGKNSIATQLVEHGSGAVHASG